MAPRGARRLASLDVELSAGAKTRLKWMDYYEASGGNARKTCRYFGISPQTFYRWRGRFDARDLHTLEERSRRPRKLRRPTWSVQVEEAVLALRRQFPRWGKDKLVLLARQQGLAISISMVGRILARLKERRVLVEPERRRVSARKRWHKRPYAIRKPKDYAVAVAGDLVEVDTLDVRPLPGVVLKHFTGRDVVSRWDVLEAYTSASAHNACRFLDTLVGRMPFPVQAIQVDGGSEFHAEFEAECARRGIRLFVLPPRSPKLNGHVERAQRTHTEEFYEVCEDLPWTVRDLNPRLRQWEDTYNTVRPHQALGYLTPRQFLDRTTSPAGDATNLA